jgi:hypothetical protein
MPTATEQYAGLMSADPSGTLAHIFKRTHSVQLLAEAEQARKANAPAAPATVEIPDTPTIAKYEKLRKKSEYLGDIFQLTRSNAKKLRDEEAALDAALLAIPPDQLEAALAARTAKESSK